MTPTEFAQEAFQRRHRRKLRNRFGYPLTDRRWGTVAWLAIAFVSVAALAWGLS